MVSFGRSAWLNPWKEDGSGRLAQDEKGSRAKIAAKVTEVLADLILLAPPDEQVMMMADVVANLGGMVLDKSQQADQTVPAVQATERGRARVLVSI